MKARHIGIVTTILALLFGGAACDQEKSAHVIFWPGDAAKLTDSAYRLKDPDNQIAALRAADPEQDAKKCFAKSDFRFIAEKPGMPQFYGIPNDSASEQKVDDSVKATGYKVIAFPNGRAQSREFDSLSRSYAEKFNGTMFTLLQNRL